MVVTKPLKECRDWDEIVVEFTRRVQDKLRNPQKYYEWLLTKQGLSGGKPLFDAETYLYCYKVSQLINTRKQDWFTVVCGKEGTGKSTLAAQLSAVISPSFRKDNIIFDPSNFVRAVREAVVGDTLHIDEGVLFLFSKDVMKGVNKDINRVLQMMRQKRLHIIICIPRFKDVDAYIRQHRVDTLFQFKMVGSYRLLNDKGVEILNQFYPRKDNSVLGVRVPVDCWVDQHNRKMFPTVNDIDMGAYEDHKAHNFDDILSRMESKLGVVEKGKAVRDELEAAKLDSQNWITVKEAMKLLPLTNTAILRRIHLGQMRGRKMGFKWLVHKDDVLSYEDNGDKVKLVDNSSQMKTLSTIDDIKINTMRDGVSDGIKTE